MNGSNFTNKAQDAIMQAQQLAQEKGQQQIDALHLLYSLLSQEGSIIITVLQKLGVDVDSLKKKAESQITKIPVISTATAFGQFYLTQDMAKVLDRARQEAMNMQDEFISVEHLFLALLDVRSNAKDVLEKISFFNSLLTSSSASTNKIHSLFALLNPKFLCWAKSLFNCLLCTEQRFLFPTLLIISIVLSVE